MVKCDDKVDGFYSQEGIDCSNDEQENLLIYRVEIYCLESFKNWFCQLIVWKEDLVRNGFYYFGDRDRV